MIRITRKFILILALICFATVATGIALELHLATNPNHKHHKKHLPDPGHCPICRQLLVTLSHFNIEQQPQLPAITEVQYFVYLYTSNPSAALQVKSFYPRPPPFVLS